MLYFRAIFHSLRNRNCSKCPFYSSFSHFPKPLFKTLDSSFSDLNSTVYNSFLSTKIITRSRIDSTFWAYRSFSSSTQQTKLNSHPPTNDTKATVKSLLKQSQKKGFLLISLTSLKISVYSHLDKKCLNNDLRQGAKI
jgi:hypothetical protein